MKLQKTLKITVLLAGIFSLNQSIAQQKNPGINLDLMDKTIKPSEDFFKFVNGTWLKNTEIPADKTRWGSFDELRQRTDKDALAILADATKDPKYTATTDQGKPSICIVQ
jgi:putative endopeptidase